MLVLSRKNHEVIKIGHDIEVCVVEIRGDKVRLGVTAPPHIPVHRQEVYDAIYTNSQEVSNVISHGLAKRRNGLGDDAGNGIEPKA